LKVVAFHQNNLCWQSSCLQLT